MPRTTTKMPLLLIICGPFACGKNALIRLLLATGRFKKVISATTRKPREGEKDGVDYHFMSRAEFKRREARGEFLETAENHGNLYGTLKSSVLEALEDGEWVLIHVDVQGVEALKRSDNELISNALISIYIEVDLVDSIERARSREGGMSDSEIVTRIITRESEEEKKHICDYRIQNPNGKLGQTFQWIDRIVTRREIEYYCDR